MEYDFEKLHVYQKSLILVERVYAATKDFPKEEQFGVTSQIRRASLSIPLNIAEGKGRYHKKVLVQFLYQARGSLYETIALIKVAKKLGYFNEMQEKDLFSQAEEVSRLLSAFINAMK